MSDNRLQGSCYEPGTVQVCLTEQAFGRIGRYLELSSDPDETLSSLILFLIPDPDQTVSISD